MKSNMKQTDIDSKPAGYYAAAAAANARMRNYVMESHYSESQKLQADRMKLVLGELFAHKGIHINYRKKSIGVKVTDAILRARKRELVELENGWKDDHGIERKNVPGSNHIIYHLPKV